MTGKHGVIFLPLFVDHGCADDGCTQPFRHTCLNTDTHIGGIFPRDGAHAEADVDFSRSKAAFLYSSPVC